MNQTADQDPIFKSIFGASWDELPPVIKAHYANRPYTNDRVTAEGTMDFVCRGPFRLFSGLLWHLGSVPPINEDRVPVTVHFESSMHDRSFSFDRVFHFKDREAYHFKSRMILIHGNEVIERMRFGFCWRMNYQWADGRVILRHKGYAFHIFGYHVPLPVTFLLGRSDAEEIPTSGDSFDMRATVAHPLWGIVYEYKGQFKIKAAL